MIIAIDGYSATGKSSISKEVAKKLGFTHIDTGAMYRAITWYAMQHYFDNNSFNFNDLINELPTLKLSFYNDEIYLNGKNIESEIRKPEVSKNSSEIAKIKEIRDFLVALQRKMAENGNIVMDGRDISSVVFPDAEIKIFLTASLEERARRRFLQLQKVGNEELTVEQVMENIKTRDEIDTTRAIAPLQLVDDAILVDNTHINFDETVEEILKIIDEKANKKL